MRYLSGKGAALTAGVLLAATLALRPLAYGLAPVKVAVFWAWVLLGVGLPGVALCWAAGLYRRDAALLLGQGFTLGLALHGSLLLAGRALGVEGLADTLPFLALGVASLARRRKPDSQAVEIPQGAAALALVVLVGCLLQPLVSLRLLGAPLPADLLYHAGNAAELAHRWPLQDPRVAGLPLNYPVLAYAVPAEGARLTGLPVADAMYGLASLFWIGLLGLQLHNAGRVLLRDAWSATLGTLVVLLHEDVGGWIGLGRGAFSSNLATGIYGSPTTICGLIFFAAIAIAVFELLAGPRVERRAALGFLAACSLAASLTKATVVPPAAAGCLLVGGWAAVTRRVEPARVALLCVLLLGVVAAPFTLQLGAGDNSYGTILRWDPGAIVRQSELCHSTARALGVDLTLSPGADPSPAWLVAAIAPLWFLGYLGLAGLGAIAFFVHQRGSLSDAELFSVGAFAAAALPALLLDAHGMSQLFFLYNGQLLLGLFAGGGIVRVWRRRPAAPVLLIVLALAALPSLDRAGRLLLARPEADYTVAAGEQPDPVKSYAEGLAWLRAYASRDRVVFADNPSLLLSAFGEVRMYYETGLYSPRGWQERWQGASEPFPEKAALQERLLRDPGPDVVAAVHRLFPRGASVLVVADNVQSRIEAGLLRVSIGTVPARPLVSTRWFRVVFANPSVHVYRLEGS